MAKIYQTKESYWEKQKKDLDVFEQAVEDLHTLDALILETIHYAALENRYGELSIPYIQSEKPTLDELDEDVTNLQNYARWIQHDLEWREWEFAKALSKAVEGVSKLNLADYTTANTLGIDEKVTTHTADVSTGGVDNIKVTEITQKKSSINIADIALKVDIFNIQNEYDAYRANNGGLPDSEALKKEYYGQFLNTSFDHKVQVDGALEVVSTVLDYVPFVGSAKQLVEGISGTTLTGEELSSNERWQYAIMGTGFLVLDFATFGIADVGAGGARATATKFAGKMAIQTASGIGIKVASDKLVELGVPPEFVFLAIVSGSYVYGKHKVNKAKGAKAEVEALGESWKLKYKTTSGLTIEATAGKTTTIIGNYNDDMKNIVEELGNIKSTDFGAKPGGFNILNVADDEWSILGEQGFWEKYNAPWLQEAIDRGDIIQIATPISDKYIYKIDDFGNRVLTGLGKEVQMLDDSGYIYDITTSTFYKP